MSMDHKATNSTEARRVKALGGNIENGRIFAKLAITRAFGDFELKHKMDMDDVLHEVYYVSIEPDVRYIKVNFETDTFMLLASDGIFDRITSQQACEFITREINAQPPGKQDLTAIAKKLADEAIEKKRIKDNVTAVIVAFR